MSSQVFPVSLTHEEELAAMQRHAGMMLGSGHGMDAPWGWASQAYGQATSTIAEEPESTQPSASDRAGVGGPGQGGSGYFPGEGCSRPIPE